MKGILKSKSTNRDRIIEELYEIMDDHDKDELTGKTYQERVADFIIARESRILNEITKLIETSNAEHKRISQSLINTIRSQYARPN